MSGVYSLKRSVNRAVYLEGLKVGFPIAMGYLVVSFALGMQAKEAGLTVFQASLASCLCSASAGEYAGFTAIAEKASYATIILATLIANGRYFLTSCALGQRMSPKLSLTHRAIVALDLTDELFGVSILRPKPYNPWYAYGIMTITIPCWTAGTALGVAAGNILPARAVSALSVALFGMFVAVIVPPGRRNKVVGVLVLASFILSFAASKAPVLSAWKDGTRTVALTILVASAAALFFPVKDDPEENSETALDLREDEE